MSRSQAHLIHWLCDACAMEKHSNATLGAQASLLRDDPHTRMRIAQLLEETLDRRPCLSGVLPAPIALVIAGTAGQIAVFHRAVIGMTVSDEVVKDAVTMYVFERMEIAS